MKYILKYARMVLTCLAFVGVFFVPTLWGQALVFLFFVLLSVISAQRKAIFGFFSKLVLLVLFTLLVHLFFRFGEAAYWQAFTQWALWDKALYFTVRNANILFIMSYLIKSGPALSFSSTIAFLEKFGPPRLVQPLALAMRYTSLIRDEFKSLQQVHRIMGIRRPKYLIARTRYYISLIFPTIISSLERAEHLSIAMTSRGYNQE
ncbi:MAG: energy-coupling factor transporter transmembrane protein EcfT [FCB group bacterium]|nr:energy-coupling factor transporter transmembrane protein EcfT [FCB group bacterium]